MIEIIFHEVMATEETKQILSYTLSHVVEPTDSVSVTLAVLWVVFVVATFNSNKNPVKVLAHHHLWQKAHDLLIADLMFSSKIH